MEHYKPLFPPPNLPLLLPDETLYSWRGHVHIWNSNASVIQTSKQLFNNRYAALLHDFPSFLGTLIEKTGDMFDSSNELALKSTLLGYFLAFQKTDLSHKILETIHHNNYPSLKYKLGLIASGIGANHPLKHCHQCLSEDIARFGRGYWHLSQQFPSTFVCLKHKQPLNILRIKSSPVHLRSWLLPETVQETEKLRLTHDQHIDRLMDLAHVSSAVAQQPPGTFDGQILAWLYQGQLKKKSLLTERGSLRIKQINALVAEYYIGLDQLPEFQILNSLKLETGGFIGSIARKKPKRGHPFKHLLFINFLFNHPEEFLTAYQKATNESPNWVKPAPLAKPKPKDPRINELLTLVRAQGNSLTQAAKLLGISVTTATQWAKKHGLAYTPRTKTLNPELLEKVTAEIKNGTPKAVIVETTRISLVSLNRLLFADKKLNEAWKNARFRNKQKNYRLSWIGLIESRPGVPAKHLRNIPGNGYTWLHRHDREWLSQHLPGLFINHT